ncbi:fibronectin type III domain-containing protein [Devosia aquimaris]|uniref:fibronectin type III domain-containing protein n=1 Tax=Devosia aquimaris TaxID=2866214 RepID=UPI001CD0AB3A|nr:fibronectin type III domain-containing protein [Devosia sp. CJK-A8-3]
MSSFYCAFSRVLTATLLVLAAMVVSMPVAWAMSNGCAAINQTWGAGVTLPNAFSDYMTYQYQLTQGETVTYFVRSQVSPVAGGNTFQLQPSWGELVLLDGSMSQVQEISGVRQAPFNGAEVQIDMFSNPDTRIYAMVTCEGSEPKITSITPSTTNAAAPEMLVIRGKNLSDTSGLKFGTFDAFPYVRLWSPEQLEVQLPAQAVGTVNVVAQSSQGYSASSAATKVTFALAPGAPTISSAIATGTTAEVAFSTPPSNGAAILDYTVVATPGNRSVTGAASPLSIAGLDTGTSYTFAVTARNVIGSSAPSVASDSLLIKTPQSITFAPPPAIAFGATTTVTANASSGLDVSFSTTTPAICQVDTRGAVTPVLAGDCVIHADQAGDNTVAPAPRVTQTLVITAVVPQAPVLTGVTPGNGSATVAFTAPSFTGGAALGAYRVTATPGGAAVDGASSPITVPGLTNGVTYRFSVTASNSAGASVSSNQSGDVTPRATQTITLSDPGTVRVSDNITITATASSGLTVALSTLSPAICTIAPSGVVTLLWAGTCSIVGQQAGNQSVEPAPQVNRDFAVLATLPGAPTQVSAVAVQGQATVSFSAPAFTGGVDIDSYTVTASPGGASATGAASPITVMGLTDGTDYSFVVSATNRIGTGTASDPSGTTTPKSPQTITLGDPGGVPFGPAITLVASASSRLALTFATTTPAICTVNASGVVSLVSPGLCTITADQPGDRAFLPAPQASVSFPVQAVVPDAPTQVSVQAGDRQVAVSFVAPAFTGGSPVSRYTVTAQPGGATASDTASPIVLAGLSNGVAYSVTVTAINGVGTGRASLASAAVTPQASQVISFTNPGPRIIGATLSLTANSNSGLPISFTSRSLAVRTTTAGGAVSLLAAGSCVIDAAQPGDGANLPAVTVTQTFQVSATQLTLGPAGGALASATIGNAYSVQLTASGQSGTLVWSLRTGRLPDGLALDSSTGLICGTPLASALGTQSFEIAVTDQTGGGVASASLSILVTPREIAAPARSIVVPGGSTPPRLDLTAGATGGPFSSAQIVSVDPDFSGTAAIIAAPAVLQFTPNPKFTGEAIVRYTLTSAIGTSTLFTVRYSLSADVAKVTAELTQMRDQFVTTRSNLWVSGISVPNLQDRTSAVTANQPGTVSLSPRSGNSLTMAYAASTQNAAVGAAESLAKTPVDDGGLRFWIDGSNTIHVRTGNAGERWGSAAALSLGADMLAAKNLLLGVSVHADWMDEQGGRERSKGNGLAVGPYFSAGLSENLYLDAGLIYGQSWNTLTDGFFSGTFGTTRWLARAGLSGSVALTDDLTLLPKVALFYLREDAQGYVATNAGGTQVTIQPMLIEQLRANAGATLRYRLLTDTGLTIQPFVEIDLGTTLSAGKFTQSAALSGGVDLSGSGNWTIGL